ncbi:MAG: DUF2752 domain-containing protein [Lachnospiraceae bacterium]|jgi:Protein of unknown function (DUF2752).|nr:DUF2752 domain-containing protein [Lachnospiraceae bacterium]MBQ6637459.1 DUF2752 domain-containing protein [Lachnospiraceae bacterium]MBR3637894.1 DUF2752 domain-containing protein [Lachnospiraceae bacterium]
MSGFFVKKSGREFKDDASEAWYTVGKVFLGIFAVVTIVFLIWGDHLIHGKIGCIVYLLFHVYCPGCGCTRATYWLVHLHPFRSFLCNPFILVSIVMYTIFMINTFLCTHTKKLGFTGMPVTKMVYADLILLVVQCIIRNILLVGFHITCL